MRTGVTVYLSPTDHKRLQAPLASAKRPSGAGRSGSCRRVLRACYATSLKGFFAIRTKRRLKRGVFKGVVDLQAAINRFVADHNQQPKPFVWTADPDKIIA